MPSEPVRLPTKAECDAMRALYKVLGDRQAVRLLDAYEASQRALLDAVKGRRIASRLLAEGFDDA